MMSADAQLNQRPQSAIARRALQLERWRAFEENAPSADLKKRPRRVRFSLTAEFFAAIAERDLPEARRLLKLGVDADARNEDGLSALHQAVIDDNAEAVDFLIEQKADLNAPDNEGWTPLHAAASCGHVSVAKKLLEAGADKTRVNADGELALDLADSDELEALLAVEDSQALRRGEEQAIQLDVQRWARVGRVEEAVDPRSGAGVLHVCAAKGYHDLLQRLLSEPSLRASLDLNALDADGWTPLMAACFWQHADCVRLLLDAGASLEQSVHAQTAATLAGDNTTIKQLLDARSAQERSSESQRRAHAKRVRETRRSTQGVRVEDVAAAAALQKETQQLSNKEPPPPARAEPASNPSNERASFDRPAASLSSTQSSRASSTASVVSCQDCERLRLRLAELETERRDWTREKRALQRKTSELEEELKQLEAARADNARLRDENCALIRVISKLSK